MHVRVAAEIPEHRRSFDLPHIPHAVVANIVVLVKCHMQIVEAVCLDQLHGFFGVGFAERREHIGHHFADMVLLVAA